MRRNLRPALTALLTALTASVVVAGENPNPAEKAFEQIKALAGEWRGTNSSGDMVEITYELAANGTAVLETFSHPTHPNMLTLYHLDGDTLLLTHYCAAGNQPRMRASKFDDGTLRFDFVDVTGSEGATAGHMHHAELDLGARDRYETRWTWYQDGAEGFTETVQAVRVATDAH